MASEKRALKVITPEQLADFKRDGFLVIKGRDFFTEHDIQRLIDITNDIQAWPETPGKWMMYFESSKTDGSRILQRIENFFKFHDEYNELFNGKRILDTIGDLFEEDAVTYKEKINFKLPGAQGFEPHQDHAAGWWRYGHTIHITMLVCVDPCTAANGALEVVRAEHTKGLLGPEYEAVPPALCEQYNWEMYVTY
jgi:2-aminoethylphosphonate dioxygenase